MTYRIMCGDCLEVMKTIPAGSVDLVLCDLPYGTVKGMKLNGWRTNTTAWDEQLDTNSLFHEYERVLRMNGVAILFSQEPYTSNIRTHKQENFAFLYPLIWKKNHFANSFNSKKAPVSYFEDLSVFSKRYDREDLHPLREYSAKLMAWIGLNKTQLIEAVGQKVDHFFRPNSSQYTLCTRETYQELIDVFGIDKMEGFLPFEELQKIDRQFARTFNLKRGQKHTGNILEFKKESKRYHPTQKPVALLEHLINTYTNKGDTVLDNCMGGGSTGVACKNTGRNFIGIEINPEYYEVAKRRIEGWHQQAKLDTQEAITE